LPIRASADDIRSFGKIILLAEVKSIGVEKVSGGGSLP
jgi:hypothetical protein